MQVVHANGKGKAIEFSAAVRIGNQLEVQVQIYELGRFEHPGSREDEFAKSAQSMLVVDSRQCSRRSWKSVSSYQRPDRLSGTDLCYTISSPLIITT